MPQKKRTELDRIADSIEKLLVLELWAHGVPQGKIAKTVVRKRSWVTTLVKGIPKGASLNAKEAEAKEGKKQAKGKRRSRR
jgi:hypothetical protein